MAPARSEDQMLQGRRFLNSARYSKIIETLSSRLDRSRPLRFLDRIATVNALDDEIVGRFTGNIYAADIIADDQEAVTYEAGRLELIAQQIPNLKIGSRIPQAMLKRMAEMNLRASTAVEEDAMRNYEMRLAEHQIQGVRQRANSLVAAMLVDDLSYDGLGVKIEGSFGTPSDLKVTPETTWDDTDATPVSDILSLVTHAADAYGQVYDRITMPLRVFQYVVRTTEFKQLATALYSTAILQTAVNAGNVRQMRTVLGELLEMTVEIEDATYKERTRAGVTVTKRVLPASKVLLTNSADDQNPMAMDLANGIVVESLVAELVGAPAGAMGMAYGPIGYYTGRPDLNPPDAVAWAVQRCMPRKHVPEASAVLTVLAAA
jgi:hypothetical protein